MSATEMGAGFLNSTHNGQDGPSTVSSFLIGRL